MKYKQLKFMRLRTGREHQHFNSIYAGKYISVGFGLDIDLSNSLFDNWRDFNKKYIPEILKREPNKSRVGAGLNCGVIWTLSKGLEKDAIVLCQDEDKNYHPCKIISVSNKMGNVTKKSKKKEYFAPLNIILCMYCISPFA